MPIRIRDSADPLSEGALQRVREVILARSEASRVLQYELRRYCNNQIGGRSFLIAGHRGAGKTTMVADALNHAIASRTAGCLRPLPILLHGPSLLETLPSDLRRDNLSLERTNGVSKNGKAGNVSHVNGPPAQPPAMENHAVGGDAQGDAPASTLTVEAEKQAQVALVHVILGLHRAVVREFALKYRDKVLQSGTDLPGAEAGELASQFEVELHEDPPAFRLREYWQYAGAMSSGILFDKDRPPDQGARELVAINGICNAHQRISGALSHEEHQQRAQNIEQTTTGGFDAKAIDALKPLGAVLAGAGFAGAAAVSSNQLLIPSLMGLATAVVSSLFLKSTVTSTSKRQRDVDRTFIPDLTPRTLDRVLPTLINRLKHAGLAPVLIVDELDKVGDLATRLEHIIHYLKKLMAEEVFSCFLTDRGYLEWLRLVHKDTAYCRASSYFSHQLLIAYTPQDIDTYLTDLLEVGDESDSAAPVDREVLKWVLRHRSQLHALSLSRELAAIRSYDGYVNIPPEAIRDTQYRIDVTLQMAIELQLYSKEVAGWRHRQSGLQQALFDALYYLSRSWLRGDRDIDLSPANRDRIVQELTDRMNLGEAASARNGLHDAQPCEPSQPPGPELSAAPLNRDDVLMLTTILERMVQFLSPRNRREDVEDTWHEVVGRLKDHAVQAPTKAVMEALLLEGRSLLKPIPADDGSTRYAWRYWRSGELRDPLDLKLIDSEAIRSRADQCIEYITQVEMSLLSVLAHPDHAEDARPFSLLSESCRVLSTSPAWLQVRTAISNLERLRAGTGDPSSIEQDCDRIEEFAGMVREGEQTVVKVLLASAVLCGVSEGGARPLSMKDAIAMLSAALGFARLNPAGVRKRMQAFWAELRSAYGHAAFDEGVTDGEFVTLTGPSLAAKVEQFVDKGKHWALDWNLQQDAAWKSVERRLRSHEDDKGSGFANLAEILCAAQFEGPSPAPGVDLERIPLDVWTSILVNAMRSPTAPKARPTPPWLVGLALRNLGAQNLKPDVLQQLPAAFKKLGTDIEFQAYRGKPATAGGGQIAVIVRRSSGSLTQTWASPPTLGMVLIVEAQHLIETHLIDALLKALPSATLHIAWEEPVDRPDIQSNALSQLDSDRIHTLHMYATAPATAKEPHIVDPTGPDALLRRVRTADPPRP